MDNSELLHMLEVPESLKSKVEEAVTVLRDHQVKEQDQVSPLSLFHLLLLLSPFSHSSSLSLFLPAYIHCAALCASGSNRGLAELSGQS